MKTTTRITKKSLRNQYLALRNSLPMPSIEAISWNICQQLQDHFEWQHCQCLHVYLPILSKKEINTLPFIYWIWQNYPNIKLCVPIVSQYNRIQNVELRPDTTLKKGSFGVSEPQNTAIIPQKEIQIILMPLVVADHNGNRIGYGKGHYDAFLENCLPSALRVGLSVFTPISPVIEAEPHDKPLDFLISYTQIHSFINQR
jgi:5-formyltetrahydrofolate cyclo-ligase